MKLKLANPERRMRVVALLVAVVVSVCGARLFQLQALDASAYAASAAKQIQRSMPLLPSRGTITDRNDLVMARTEPAVAVTADPSHTTAKATQIADVLVRHLGGTTTDYLPKLTKPDARFVYIKKKVPSAKYQRLAVELNDSNLYGIFRESDPIRTYPGKTIGSNIVGFVDNNGKGAGGFEYGMNAELSGTEGREIYESDARGNRIPLGTEILTPAVNGRNYQLTLDSELQWMAERRLAQQVKMAKGESGTAITMNIKTGEVLAMANYPSYNSNNPGKADSDDRGNRVISAALEPGSVQKVLTMGALLDAGLITPDTKITVPPKVKSGGGYITDSSSHGYLQMTARGVMAKSSNIGTTLLARRMEKGDFAKYMRDFGLGAPTGIELPGEASGSLPGADMPDYTLDQIAFGQGVSMTSLQFTAALAGLMNDGVYNPPTIVKSATDADGKPVEVPHGEPRRIISSAASKDLASMMESVLDRRGTGAKLKIRGYRTGGKTATAERVDPKCGCYRGYTSGYVGMAPADDPHIVTYVTVDKPKNGHYGSTIAGPVYHDLTVLALQRYGIKPSTGKSPKGGLTW